VVSVYPKAEILFPPRLIPSLRDLRGPEWAELIGRVSKLPETHPDVLAFCLMMIELDGCLNCYAGSYKFMRGCTACARQAIAQYKGTDADLLDHFQRARADIQAYLEGRGGPAIAALEEEAEPPLRSEEDEEPEEDVPEEEEEEETEDDA
jgi:hypothetical protein